MALSDPQPPDGSAWWASSEPAPDAVPPKSQLAEVRHALPATQQAPVPEPPADESETPTAPHSAMTIEQAAQVLATAASEEHDTVDITDLDLDEGTRQL
ncbi:MAG: hypothetical protein JNK74_28520, partial [Candidatus Hydrogenedentes bacterium]|nr:hypothetical protein [Candidatus Hydrogenedentota bacterium]